MHAFVVFDAEVTEFSEDVEIEEFFILDGVQFVLGLGYLQLEDLV